MRSVLVAVALLAATSGAWAIQPATWSQGSESDFTAGKLDKVAVDNQGEVRLARAVEALVPPQEKLGMISAMAVSPKGTIYVAASPGAQIYRAEGGKLVPLAQLTGALVRTLVYDKGYLLAGTSGKGAGVYRIDGEGKVTTFWADEKVTFVWAIVPAPRGGYYVATGAAGNIYQIDAQGQATAIYHSSDKNIMCLIAGQEGLLYAGTGESGLVLEINPLKKTGRVLYDANEKEISSLVLGEDGTLFAATSDSSKSGAHGSEHATPSRLNKLLQTLSPTSSTSDEGNADDEEGDDGDSADEPESAMATPAASKPAKTTAHTEAKAQADAEDASSAVSDGDEEEPQPTPSPSSHRVSSSLHLSGLGMGMSLGTGSMSSGNAVYRIDKNGCVRPIFRKTAAILTMAMHETMLTLGTGHSGQIYVVDPTGKRSSLLATVDPKDVTTLLADGKGKLYAGTANQAGVYVLTGQVAPKGTLTSKVLDAGQMSRWGTLSVRCELPSGSGGTIATRSGNVAKADDSTWSEWSAETPVADMWTPISSPAGRFLQYRVTLSGSDQSSPVLEQVQLTYQVYNIAPVIGPAAVQPTAQGQSMGMSMGSSMRSSSRMRASAMMNSEGAATPEPMRYRSLAIRANDANGDELEYSIYYRRTGDEKWIRLADKQAEPMYSWDTLGVRDGVYDVKIEVSDAKSNPPGTAMTAEKIVRGVIVDNTAPVVTDLLVKPDGKGKASLTGSASDATSRIGQIAYSVDSNDKWIMLLPTDGICDSPKETFSTQIDLPDAGRHRIAVRVMDEFDNAGYSSIEVTVP